MVMSIDDYVYLIAGSFIVLSLVLNFYISKYWLLLTLFVGLNLIQLSMTKFCPLKSILKRLI